VARVVFYEPVFFPGNTSQLKGVLTQGFVIETFVERAFAGFDNSTIQFIWRDLAPDTENASIVYQLHTDASDVVGSLEFVRTIAFAQRMWQFEFRNLDHGASTQQITDGGILAAFVVILLAIIIVTFFFVRFRYLLSYYLFSLKIIEFKLKSNKDQQTC
jgi:hypothetical protein